jgi:hypothetical protein
MRILFWIEDASAFADRLRQAFLPELFGGRLGYEAAAATPAYQLIDTLYNFVR